MTNTRPTWAEVSRGNLVHNYRLLRRLAGPDRELLAVVKANAYGHGMLECAPLLAEDGCGWFGVTCMEEGVALRRVCPEVRIVLLSGLWRHEAETALEYRLTPVVWEPFHLDWLVAAAGKHGAADGPVAVHVEIDTGMSRQGVAVEALEPLLGRFGPEGPLRLEAVMTHFHSPENETATEEQGHCLARAAEVVTARGLRPAFVSAGSSAAVLNPDRRSLSDWTRGLGARDMVRPGIALYGYAPGPGFGSELLPVLRWKTRVVSLRTIEAGTAVGYEATFVARRRSRLALLPLGYGDGLNRLLSNRGSVLVRGERAAVAGRISMDHTVVDVTDIPGVEPGDEVTVIGRQGGDSITAEEMAAITGTISYEILCAISARVPRVMVD